MYTPDTEELRFVIKSKGYNYFVGHMNINLVGIRSENSQSNQFDDILILTYQSRGKEYKSVYPITTDPGKKYLLNPLQGSGGTLIMVPGQYRSAYMIGIHGRSRPKEKQYTALEQIGPMCYVRDKSLDAKLNFDLYRGENRTKNLIWGNFKSNIHRGNSGWISKLKGQHLVDGHSAGCQVFQYADQFAELLAIADNSRKVWGNTFTYTLLEERDFTSISTTSSIK
jgi:hypothetical protein